MDWNNDIKALVPEGDELDLVISPDVDGLLSAGMIATRANARIAAVYTTRHVVLLGDTAMDDLKDALWVDHDISRQGMRCVGQHLVLHSPEDRLPLRDARSFNPNVHLQQAYYGSFLGTKGRARDKYPFGTVHLFHAAFGLEIPKMESMQFAALAHADGSWATCCDYPVNVRVWQDAFFNNEYAVIDQMIDGYIRSDDARGNHARLVEKLVEAGVRKSGSKEKTTHGFPAEWSSMQGNQSITFSLRGHNPVEGFARNRDTLDAVARLLQRETGYPIPPIERVSGYQSGQYNQIYPNQVARGSFDEYMVSERIFSHAFTAQNSLRFTTELF